MRNLNFLLWVSRRSESFQNTRMLLGSSPPSSDSALAWTVVAAATKVVARTNRGTETRRRCAIWFPQIRKTDCIGVSPPIRRGVTATPLHFCLVPRGPKAHK